MPTTSLREQIELEIESVYLHEWTIAEGADKIMELVTSREELVRSEERTEVNVACVKLAEIADWKTVSDETRSFASLALTAKAEADRSKLVRDLQERLRNALNLLDEHGLFPKEESLTDKQN